MPPHPSTPSEESIYALNPQSFDTLRQVDPDRYRSALLAGGKARAALLVIYAFHYELAKVPELVSEPMIGAIRYQWWREALDEIYGQETVRAHEITTPLSAVLTQRGVPRFWADQLIDGRARDLDPRPFDNLDEAKDYCLQTSGKLMQIAVQALAPDLRLTPEQTDGVNAAGLAWGLTGLARAYGYYHTGMLSKLAYADILNAARMTYTEAQNKLGNAPAQIMPAIAYASLVPKFISRLGKRGFDPLQQTVSYSPLAKQLRLLGTSIRGKL